MVNGDWNIQLSGNGKIHPCTDADSIDKLLTDFITDIKAKGHTQIGGSITKNTK